MSNPIRVIALAGKMRAGKGEVLEILYDLLDGEFAIASTSDALVRELSRRLSFSPDEIRDNKSLFRERLQALGDEYEKREPAGVLNLAMENVPVDALCVVDSIRRNSELWKLGHKPDVLYLLVDADPAIREARGAALANVHPTEHEAYLPLHARYLSGDPNVVLVKNNAGLAELSAQIETVLKQWGFQTCKKDQAERPIT